jgi:dipeptidyl-peptidase 4
MRACSLLSLVPAITWLILCPGAGSGAETNAPRVYREKVEPRWLEHDAAFWYRVTTGPGRSEFVFVNAQEGTRKLAFDHQKLADALARSGFAGAKPENLPIDSLQFAGGELSGFRSRGKDWSVNQPDYVIHEIPSEKTSAIAAEGRNIPAASTRTGAETTLTFSNQTEAEVETFWLDSEGERRSYGKLKPGETREQHTFAGHVWLVADAAGKKVGIFEASDESSVAEIVNRKEENAIAPPPRRRRTRTQSESPDGQWQPVFIEHNLSLTNTTTGKSQVLTTDGNAEDSYSEPVIWSPDSRRVVAIKNHKGDDRKVYLVESSPKDQLQPKLHTIDYPKPGDNLTVERPHLFDVTSGKEIALKDELFSNPWSIGDFQWSADSAYFSFLYNERGHQVLRLLKVDAKSGDISSIIEERSSTFIDYSGKMYLDRVDSGAGNEVIWMSERDGWNHLYLYDADTCALKNQITRGPWVVRGVDWVDKEKRQIWFRAAGLKPEQDPYWMHHCRVNFDGSGLTVLSAGEGTHQVKYSPEHRYLVDTWSRVDQAPVNDLRDASDGRLICNLEQPDTNELKTSNWRAPQRFTAKGRDGKTDIYGIIHWPAEFDPGRKYPVVESIYAGPQGAFVPKNFRASYSLKNLTDRGFVVVQIDGMGTSDRSKAFHDVCWKNLGDSGFPDRILWMQAAAAQYPAIDLTRVGIYGTSAGGQSALRALLAHGDFYKVGVADSGCHDNRMDKIWWNEQWMGWPIGPHYEEQSNVTQAHKLQGKLLLMVGELDRNVDPSSTLQVVNALIKADKDFDLLFVPGAGHGVLGLPYAQGKMVRFFEQNLKSPPL